MLLENNPAPFAGTAVAPLLLSKLHQLYQLAKYRVLLELFGQRFAMFSYYQLERAETHPQMAKTAPVPM